MDPQGRIYKAPEDEIPAEDKARLEGFLEAQARETEMHRLKDRIEAVDHQAVARDRIKRLTETYFPPSEKYGGDLVVHRSFVAQAFEAGARAAMHFEADPGDIADAFEEWLDEEFTE